MCEASEIVSTDQHLIQTAETESVDPRREKGTTCEGMLTHQGLHGKEANSLPKEKHSDDSILYIN